VQYPFGDTEAVFEVVEEEPEQAQLDTSTQEYKEMNPIEFFSQKGLVFDNQLNLFYCKKCDTHIINRTRNGFIDENLTTHLKQPKHRGKRKVVEVDCRLALEKFKQSEEYVQFDPRQVFNGMESVKNIKIVQLPFKCGECDLFSNSVTVLKRHFDKIHGDEFHYEHGVFECQKIFSDSGFIRVAVPAKPESKRASLAKRPLVEENVKPTVSKSKRFCARVEVGDEENMVEIGDDEEEPKHDLQDFLNV
jgi:hypothetical protein